MSSVATGWPAEWSARPLWSMFERIKDVGHPDEEMLSVYRDHGVIRKDSRDDNFNKTAENRDIYQLVHPGWLVVNRMKAWQGSLGISCVRGIVSGHYLCFRPSHDEEPGFLNYLLRSDVYRAELLRLSRGVRPNQLEIDNDLFRTVPVYLPDRDQQLRIAAFLDAETERIDRLIEAKSRMIERSVALRQSIIYEAVAGLLDRPSVGGRQTSGIPWLSTTPSSWREATLRLVARLGSGHTPSRSRPEWWEDCTVPWVTTGEVARLRSDRHEFIYETREKVSELGLANSSAVVHPAGTVVLSRTASAGYSGIMATDMATSQDFVTWTCGPDLEPRFLLLCLRAMRGDVLGRLAQGSTHKTIYMPDIESIRVPVPPLEEQVEIVESAWERLHNAGELEDALAGQIDLLQERRRSLITAVVTGEMEVA